jgi:N utilization substance protein A
MSAERPPSGGLIFVKEWDMSKEMVMMVEAIAREKGLAQELVMGALEEALAFAAKKSVGGDPKITVEIDPVTGESTVLRHWEVVDDVDLQENQDFQVLRPDLPDEMSDEERATSKGYVEVIQVELGRASAMLAKQAIYQKIKDIEQRAALDEVLDRGDGLMYGTVKNFVKGNAVLEVGRLEALLPKSEMLPKDMLKVGARVRVAIKSIERQGSREVVTASRATPEFMRLLLEQEVVQIEEGDIEIVKLVRSPGMRCKMIVRSKLLRDERGGKVRNDPARIIIGSKGIHAKAIAEETGEHMDIIMESDDPAEMVIEALRPAEPSRIRIDEETRVIEAAIADEHLGLVIGSRGMNIRLISELLGWEVDVMNEAQWEEREQERAKRAVSLFMEKLMVDEALGVALVEAGFGSMDELAFAATEEVMELGLDEETSNELRMRAHLWTREHDELLKEKYLPARESLLTVESILDEEIEQLIRAEIFSANDLADLATDELREMLPHWREPRAQALIMAARKLWEEPATA